MLGVSIIRLVVFGFILGSLRFEKLSDGLYAVSLLSVLDPTIREETQPYAANPGFHFGTLTF